MSIGEIEPGRSSRYGWLSFGRQGSLLMFKSLLHDLLVKFQLGWYDLHCMKKCCVGGNFCAIFCLLICICVLIDKKLDIHSTLKQLGTPELGGP